MEDDFHFFASFDNVRRLLKRIEFNLPFGWKVNSFFASDFQWDLLDSGAVSQSNLPLVVVDGEVGSWTLQWNELVRSPKGLRVVSKFPLGRRGSLAKSRPRERASG